MSLKKLPRHQVLTYLQILLALVLTGAGVVLILFRTANPNQNINSIWVYGLIGTGLVILGPKVLNFGGRRRYNKMMGEYYQWVENLKNKGERIEVDLMECEIRRNDYTQESEIYQGHSWQVQAGNALSNPAHVTELTHVNQAVIVFQPEREDLLQAYYSPLIGLDQASLMMKLYQHPKTYLYIDKKDNTNYFFDFDFLNY